jgi:glycerophosphoryl diester phosphodiesterase
LPLHPLLALTDHPVVGHRGNAAHAPENTMESFRQAVAVGADALELDVHLTGDGAVVVIHDPTLDRTTSGSGRVDRMTVSEVQQHDAGARFTPDRGFTWPWRDRGITVPILADVLRAFPATPLLIEIKTTAASLAVRRLVEEHEAAERCVVASFDREAMGPFRGSRMAIGSSRRDTARLLPYALLRRPAPPVDFDVMCMPLRHRGLPLPVAGYARVLRARGIPVHVWTIDDPNEAVRLWRKGVCGIISNDPAAILRARQ